MTSFKTASLVLPVAAAATKKDWQAAMRLDDAILAEVRKLGDAHALPWERYSDLKTLEDWVNDFNAGNPIARKP